MGPRKVARRDTGPVRSPARPIGPFSHSLAPLQCGYSSGSMTCNAGGNSRQEPDASMRACTMHRTVEYEQRATALNALAAQHAMWVAFSMGGHSLLGTCTTPTGHGPGVLRSTHGYSLACSDSPTHRHAYLFNATELDASTELAIFEPRVSLTKFYPLKTVLFMQCAPCNSDTKRQHVLYNMPRCMQHATLHATCHVYTTCHVAKR